MKSLALSLLTLVSALSLSAGVDNLKVNHLVAPIGVDDAAPRLQWRLTDVEPAAVRLVVGTDSAAVARGEGDMWQTERPGYSLNSMTYAGAPLRPATCLRFSC